MGYRRVELKVELIVNDNWGPDEETYIAEILENRLGQEQCEGIEGVKVADIKHIEDVEDGYDEYPVYGGEQNTINQSGNKTNMPKDNDLHPVRFTYKEIKLILHIMGHFSDYFEDEAEDFFDTIYKSETENKDT